MEITTFSIIFDQASKTYFPGETVSGKVELVLTKSKKIRGIIFLLEGRANCEWHDDETQMTRQQTETYFKKEWCLCEGKTNFQLPAGTHSYPFSVKIPSKAPSSFSGTHGSILYHVSAKIDIPWAFDRHVESEFYVINIFNLNSDSDPALRRSSMKVDEITFCCLCCTSGPLTVIARLPKTGFAVIESIPITLEVKNSSNVTINNIDVSLKRDVYYKAYEHSNYEQFNLGQIRFDGVEARQSATKNGFFKIPRTSYPFVGSCSIIDIKYRLHIVAHPSGYHSTLNLFMPITIGDIALSDDKDHEVPANETMTPTPTPSTSLINYLYSGNLTDDAPVTSPAIASSSAYVPPFFECRLL